MKSQIMNGAAGDQHDVEIVNIRVPSVIHAYSMCRVFSLLICVQIQYRTGCFEKCFKRPPVTWRHEWQDSVYTHSMITFPTKIRFAQTESEAGGRVERDDRVVGVDHRR